jgi:hypothetical protein
MSMPPRLAHRDEQQLSPLRAPPRGVFMPLDARERSMLAAGHHEAQQDELERDRGDEGMKGIKVAEAQEQEEAEETRERRDDHRDLGPVLAAAYTVPGERGVQDAHAEHGAGQSHAVVRHERQEARIEACELNPRHPT